MALLELVVSAALFLAACWPFVALDSTGLFVAGPRRPFLLIPWYLAIALALAGMVALSGSDGAAPQTLAHVLWLMTAVAAAVGLPVTLGLALWRAWRR